MLEVKKDFLKILNSIDGMLIIDKDEKLLFMNDDLARQIGYDCGEQVIGKKIREVIPTNNTHKVIGTNEKQIGEVYFVGGQTIVSNAFPIHKNGELVGAFEFDVFENATFLHSFLDRVNELSNEVSYYKQELRKIRGAKYSVDNIVGSSNSIVKLKRKIEIASKTNSTVLINGETGSGKELVAHSIHKLSTRSLRNFIKINCAAIPEGLFEAEIFGYEEGSFTGAVKGGKKGKAELANGGTLFLDEINQLPLKEQSKLLRFLQEGEISKVGGDFNIPVNVRVIAATNRDLMEMVKNREFREDLYYRLNVVDVAIDPLRKRKDDIKEIVDSLIERLNDELGKVVNKIEKVDDEVIELLKQYDWSGNVRELSNIIERGMNSSVSNTLTVNDFIDFKHKYIENITNLQEIDTLNMTLEELKEQVEIQAINNVLEKCKGNKTKASEQLGISRQMLHKKIEKYHIL